MKAIRLRTEYLDRPMGIDIVNPRFYWQCDGGIKQTAYRITAVCDGEAVWDSGKTESSSMTHIRYEGKPLKSRDRVEWEITLWDENGVEGEKSSSWFEIGLLDKADWKAQWITGDYTPERDMRYPVDCFKKVFNTSKPVKKARLYITACGLYEAKINGKRVGEFRLAPGCTDYRKRLQYQNYDITGLLTNENVLEIQLADGWYRGSNGCFGKTNVYGGQTKLLCRLEITYTDNSREAILSDGSFCWSNDGPLRFADLKDGEVYDASLTPSYCGKAVVTEESMAPTASNNVYPIQKEEFSPELITTPAGKKVLDFKQNIAGFVAFAVKGEKGRRINIRLGEILDENGEFTQKNFQNYKPVREFDTQEEILLMSGQIDKIGCETQPTPKQEIEFICSGNEDRYKTEFAVFGFQYAEVDTDIPFSAEDFKAIAVYSDMEQTGSFECSNANVNKFYQNTVWSMKSNFLDVPTDCPTRERMGWTGDGQIFFDTAVYLMDSASLFRKWLYDFIDAQTESGLVPAVIPYAGLQMMYDNTGSSVGWGDAAVLIPCRFWKRYADDSILREFYSLMRNYAMLMMRNTGHVDPKAAEANPYNKYVYEKGVQLGEWLEPMEFRDSLANIGVVPKPEECTAYLCYTMTHMAEAARALNKPEDEALFNEYAEGARRAYDYLFLQSGTIDTDRQAKLVRPLALGLLDGEKKRNVQKRLVKAAENRNYKISTGFLSTPFILPMLTEAGRADVAYKMLENEEAPGWLAEVKAGATTVWENWDGEASRNHYSPGTVCQWLFDTVAGIRNDGENRFTIAPVPGGTFTYANAEHISLYGKVTSRWEKTGATHRLIVTVPANTSADVIFPNGEKQQVSAGVYTYTF